MGSSAVSQEHRMLVLVNLAAMMERADEALLPVVCKEVGETLHASLTLFRSIVQSSCYPPSLSARSSRQPPPSSSPSQAHSFRRQFRELQMEWGWL